jgi:tRNA (guanine-N7-)-methyltransferase
LEPVAEPKPRAVDPYADAPRLPNDPIVDPRGLVGAQSPIELEIGPGRGGFIIERLEGDPTVRIVGLEIRRKWATIVDRKIGARGLSDRGRVFAADAKDALVRFPAGSVERIYLHFPDPWWKKRHRKRLVVEPDFVVQAARVLRPGGDFFVQTDVPERAESYAQAFLANPEFEAWGTTARVSDPEFGARSPRERRAMADGLPICRMRFRRR